MPESGKLSHFRFFLAVLVMALAVGCMTACARKFPMPPPEEADMQFRRAVPEEWKLPNGLTVMYLRNEEIPMVSGALFIKGGSLSVPADQIVAVDALGGQMRDGGAGKLDADGLDRTLEELAVGIGSSFGGEYGRVGFSSLSSDLDRAFSIFADVVLRPRFEEKRLELWKAAVLEDIRRRKDSPETVAAIAFDQLLYGNSHYGHVMRSAEVSAIRRVDLLRLHRRLVRPDSAILAVSGMTTRRKVEDLVQRHFAGWPARGQALPAPPPINMKSRAGLYHIELPFDQATIMIGHLGVPRLTADYLAIDMFNHVFGSDGFGSRLMTRIREQLGLSYSVYGAIRPAVVKGKNIIVMQSKVASSGEAISESIAELVRLQNEEAGLEEISDSRRSIENSFIFRFDSPGEALERNAFIRLLEYPADYDETYVPGIRKVGPADIRQVAQNRWHPEDFVIVVVGNKTSYDSLEKALPSLANRGISAKISSAGFGEAIELPGGLR